MSLLPLAIVVAVGRGGVIGKAGKIPWHFSEDMRHFKELTTGHAVVMGRKTFDSIGKPLPNRRNIVVTRTPKEMLRRGLLDPVGGTIEFTYSLHEAVAMASEGSPLFAADPEPRIIGGSEIYALAMCDGKLLPYQTMRIFLTEVDVEVEGGDSHFPMDTLLDFEEVSRRPGEDPKLSFVELRRTKIVRTIRCNIPAKTLPPCDLEWGHGGDMHASAGDGFYARDHLDEHHRRQAAKERKC